MRVTGPIVENLQTNDFGKIVVREVTREIRQEVLPDMVEIREGTVLELVGTETSFGQDDDVAIN